VRTRVLVLWVALGGSLSAGCQSDSGAICEKLFACHLLWDEAPTEDNKPGFSRDVCESQVESELGDAQREQCADCVDSHACEEITAGCHAECAPPN
jgi:hypothetical protein